MFLASVERFPTGSFALEGPLCAGGALWLGELELRVPASGCYEVPAVASPSAHSASTHVAFAVLQSSGSGDLLCRHCVRPAPAMPVVRHRVFHGPATDLLLRLDELPMVRQDNRRRRAAGAQHVDGPVSVSL